MTITKDALAQLRAPFPSASINWRVGQTNSDKTQGQALPYLDGRTIQNRLDEVLGAQNWQVEYKSSPLSNGLICRLGVQVDGQWVFKEDGAQFDAVRSDGSNNREMVVKGAYTDAFKRAAVMWGIGRYLYGFQAPWVAIERASVGNGFVLSSIPRLPAHMRPADEPEPTEASEPTSAATATPSSAPAPNAAQPAASAPPAQPAQPAAPGQSATNAPPATARPAPASNTASRPSTAPNAPTRPAQPATTRPAAPAAGGTSAKELPEGLNDEERAIVTGLLEKIARPAIPMTMLENYIAGPRVAGKLSEPAKVFLNARLAERRKRESAAA
jgi:hypothetical protein